jgi:hypothetical protein
MTLERYLKDVRTFLPADQADDIVSELAENLYAQFEDRERELGRPLTEDEQDAILKEHGKPIMVAARYRPEQQSLTFGRQLIGPALFPAYTQVLGINVVITIVFVIVAAIVVASGQPVVSAVSSVALAILIQFGVVTAIFVTADRAIAGNGSWPADAARSVPGEMQRSFPDRLTEQLIGKDHLWVVPRRTSVADLALSAITLGWLYFVRPPNVTEVLRSGPGWESFYLPIVLVIAIAAIQPIVNFFRPQWATFRSVVRILTNASVAGIFALSLSTGNWIAPTDQIGTPVEVATLVAEVNRWVGVSLFFAMGFTIAMVLLEVRRLVGGRRSRTEPGTQAG